MLIASRGDPWPLLAALQVYFFPKVSASLLAEMIGSKSISSLVHVSQLRTFH